VSRHSKTNVNSGVATTEALTRSNDLHLLERKIVLVTEGFTSRFSESILRDRNRLYQENSLVVAEYIIAMKREVNPRPNYIQYIPRSHLGVGCSAWDARC